jgi:LPXTG-motif cell wall-anchored protein
MFTTKSWITLALALAFTTLSANAATFEWVREDIDVYDLRVVAVKKNSLKAHILGIGTRTFSVPSDFRFEIDGAPTPLKNLVPRQKLRAYVTRSPRGTLQLVDAGPVEAVVPVVAPKTPVIAEVVAPMQAAVLPKTGTVLPFSLGLALASGSLALALRRRRSRR